MFEVERVTTPKSGPPSEYPTWHGQKYKILGPVVQSVVRLTSPLVVKMLIVLVSTLSNSKVFLLTKCE